MARLFIESNSAPIKVGNSWRAILITPGKGSSGVYTEKTLRESGPIAFPKGTHSYVDHPSHEGEVRSPKNLIGVLATDARYEDGVGLVAEIEVMPHWQEFVEAVAPHTGLSIYAMGDGRYNDDGEVVVEELIPNVQNSVDLVSYAGRPGSRLADKLYEAAVAMSEAAPDELKVGDFVSWNSSGGRARGRIERIVRDGSINVPDSSFTVSGDADNPAALIRIYRDGSRTDTLVGHKFSTLTKISSLDEYAKPCPPGKVKRNGKCVKEELVEQLEDAPGGGLPDAYRPATSDDVPEGRACGNCMFFNEERLNEKGEAWCEWWEAYAGGGFYCNAWKGREEEASAPMGGEDGSAASTAAATIEYKKEGYSDMELKELSDQLAELPNLVAAAVAEALAPSEEPEKDEVSVEAVAEAMVEAGLPEVSRKAVYESLRAGGDLTEAIEAQKAFVESVKAHFKEDAKAAPAAEETVIVNTEEKAPRLSDILNVKVGA